MWLCTLLCQYIVALFRLFKHIICCQFNNTNILALPVFKLYVAKQLFDWKPIIANLLLVPLYGLSKPTILRNGVCIAFPSGGNWICYFR